MRDARGAGRGRQLHLEADMRDAAPHVGRDDDAELARAEHALGVLRRPLEPAPGPRLEQLVNAAADRIPRSWGGTGVRDLIRLLGREGRVRVVQRPRFQACPYCGPPAPPAAHAARVRRQLQRAAAAQRGGPPDDDLRNYRRPSVARLARPRVVDEDVEQLGGLKRPEVPRHAGWSELPGVELQKRGVPHGLPAGVEAREAAHRGQWPQADLQHVGEDRAAERAGPAHRLVRPRAEEPRAIEVAAVEEAERVGGAIQAVHRPVEGDHDHAVGLARRHRAWQLQLAADKLAAQLGVVLLFLLAHMVRVVARAEPERLRHRLGVRAIAVQQPAPSTAPLRGVLRRALRPAVPERDVESH
mmetsp:Transcript_87528/g.267806  ORF Transcript_87528/g.267806 Transcript_87528/m.267806 type:complete len:357 (+) Transcript_87528:2354-3424(+)